MVVEAIQYDGTNEADIASWVGANSIQPRSGWLVIRIREGPLLAWKDDWIIKDSYGDTWICKPDVVPISRAVSRARTSRPAPRRMRT